MACHSWVFVNLVVIATLEGLIAEEMNCSVLDSTRQVLLVVDMLEAVTLVPSGWEDVERDLSTN